MQAQPGSRVYASGMAEEPHPPRHPTTLDEELLEAETTAILSELTDAQRVLRIQDGLKQATGISIISMVLGGLAMAAGG